MAYTWGMKLALQLAMGVVLALPTLAGEVHVVALDGTGDFSQVQDAVDFASDGDTIVVEGGTYSWTFGSGGGSALITGKGLDIVSGTGDPRLTGTIEVRDLGPGQDVRIAGLTANIVIVRDCAGDVLLNLHQDGLLIAASILSLLSLVGMGYLLTDRFGPAGMAWVNLLPLATLPCNWFSYRVMLAT